jgi:asparagine synthetase B (glutamine-hydrolysing)
MDRINTWQETVGLPIVSHPKDFKWNSDDLEKILRSSVKKCVAECLSANQGKILTVLSGGLDSSLCLALIREEFGYGIAVETYTIGANKNHPDIIYARQVAKIFKTEHHELIPSLTEIEGAKLTKKLKTELFPGETEEFEGVGVFLLIQFIWITAQDQPTTVIFHDGIDELMGGYWEHRECSSRSKKETAFKHLWDELSDKHLIPLEKKVRHYQITPLFPFLQREVVEYISKIPVEERTSHKESKIPLRIIASKYLPMEIVQRPKIGFNDALNPKYNITTTD